LKRLFLTFITLIVCVAVSMAQVQNTSTTAEAKSQAAASKTEKAIQLESGAQLVAQLQNTLDVGKVKEGDQVILKTIKAIQVNGEVVVKKGATLLGHITEVQKKSKEHNQSSLSLVFDTLESGSLSMPINATITSISRAATMINTDNTILNPSQELISPNSAASRSQGSGGLLGGLTNTVGGVVNATGQTLDGVTGSTTGSLGKATGTVGNALPGLQILQATNASAEGGSTLAFTGGNLRLEKGTSLHLLLKNESKAEAKAVKKAAKSGNNENQ
jgi:hypothetical protein